MWSWNRWILNKDTALKMAFIIICRISLKVCSGLAVIWLRWKISSWISSLAENDIFTVQLTYTVFFYYLINNQFIKLSLDSTDICISSLNMVYKLHLDCYGFPLKPTQYSEATLCWIKEHKVLAKILGSSCLLFTSRNLRHWYVAMWEI